MDARTQLRRFAALASRTAAPAVVTAGGPADHGPCQPRGPGLVCSGLPATSRARLRAIAKSAATAHGDWRPAEVTAVPTTHALAVASATTGTGPAAGPVPGDTPVYLVTMTGHFSGGGRDRTRSARAPAGRYLSLVVNARSFWVMDAGLSHKAPRVMPATLGQVTNIGW